MARDLQQSNRNELKIRDGISGGELTLYYRLPTTRERVGFQKGCYKEKAGKLINQTVAARAAYGELILTGIKDGDFVVGGQPLSSDPNSPDFRPDWKALVVATAGDLLIMLGMHVFEGAIQQLLQNLANSDKDKGKKADRKEDELAGDPDDADLPQIDDAEGGEPIGPLA